MSAAAIAVAAVSSFPPISASAAGQASVEQLQEAVRAPAFQSFLHSLDARFGGDYIDSASSPPRVFVQIVGDPTSVEAAARASFSYPEQLRSVAALHSYASLQSLSARIVGDEPGLAADGIRVAHVGPDVPANLVRIGVADVNPQVTAQLLDRYGATWVEVVTAVQSAPAIRTGVTPHGTGSTVVTVAIAASSLIACLVLVAVVRRCRGRRASEHAALRE